MGKFLLNSIAVIHATIFIVLISANVIAWNTPTYIHFAGLLCCLWILCQFILEIIVTWSNVDDDGIGSFTITGRTIMLHAAQILTTWLVVLIANANDKITYHSGLEAAIILGGLISAIYLGVNIAIHLTWNWNK